MVLPIDGSLAALQYWTQNNLPAVYDDSLSYYELLSKVIAQLNTNTDFTNGVKDSLNDLINQVNSSKWIDNNRLVDGSVDSRVIKDGSITLADLDPAITQQPTTDIGQQAKFTQIDQQLNGIALQVRASGGDDTANINSAINTVSLAGGGTVLLPDPLYSALNIQGKSNVNIVGNGTRIVKNGGVGDSHILELNGTLTSTLQTLSANANIGGTALSVADSSVFSVGDHVLIYDSTFKNGALGRNQEINRVSSISANTVTLTNRLLGAYTISSGATVVKIQPITGVKVEGITFDIPIGVSGGGLYGVLNVGTVVQKCTTLRPNSDPGFCFDQSMYVKVKECTVKDGQSVSTSGYGYGINFNESCLYCFAEDCHTENLRESSVSNNTRYSGFVRCTTIGNYDSGFNSHGTGNEHITIKDCTIISPTAIGIAVGYSSNPAQDKYIYIENNTIINAGSHGINVNSTADGLKNHKGIIIRGNKVFNYGVVTTNSDGIYVGRSDDVDIMDNKVDGNNNNNAGYGILVDTVSNTKIKQNKVQNISNGYGIQYQNATDIDVENNKLISISSHNLRTSGTNTNGRIRNNVSDDTTHSITCDVREGNIWGTKKDRDRGATPSIADGGGIAHNCVVAPTNIRAVGSVAGEFVSVTVVAATTFTVAIKKHDGTAGTPQTIYWVAEV